MKSPTSYSWASKVHVILSLGYWPGDILPLGEVLNLCWGILVVPMTKVKNNKHSAMCWTFFDNMDSPWSAQTQMSCWSFI